MPGDRGAVSFAPPASSTPAAAHHQLSLSFKIPDLSALVPGSGHFEIDGPGGHASVPADNDGSAVFRLPQVGHYEIAARSS